MLISEIVKKGWEETKKNFWFFVLIMIIFFGLIITASLVLQKVKVIGQIIIIILQFWLTVGWIIISLKIAKGEKASITDLFKGLPQLASFSGASILYFLIVLAGMILLIFPAFIWGLKYMFYPYLIVDKKMKAIEALKESSKMTNGIKWDLLGINIVLEIILFLGILALAIGLFWVYPLVMIASALIYLKISSKAI